MIELIGMFCFPDTKGYTEELMLISNFMQLSIIICTYNSAGRLEKTLDSILSQNGEDFEVVIIDGASTDGTVEIIKDYESKFAGKLRWISEKDSGIYEAMNKGVKMAQGEYLNVIGAGDWLEEGALGKVFRAMADNLEADAIYAKTRIWDKDIKESKFFQTLPEILPTQPMQHPALYYKKELHNRFGLYDERYKIVADYLFCLKAFYFGKERVKLIDDVTVNFVMDGVSSICDKECEAENKRVRRELGIKSKIKIPNPVRFIKKRMGI